MVLIADGGSTKCDWILLNREGEVVMKTRSKGLNPAVVPEGELYTRMVQNEDLSEIFETVELLDFYGAGCGTETPQKILKAVLEKIFPSQRFP